MSLRRRVRCELRTLVQLPVFTENCRSAVGEGLGSDYDESLAANATAQFNTCRHKMETMMRRPFAFATALGLSAVLGLAFSASNARAGDLKSGLAVGDAPPAFTVQDVTGPKAGEKLCYRCRYGSNPVVAVFARHFDARVKSLVKQVDAQVEKNKDKKMKAFVVLLTDDPDHAAPKLKKFAEKQEIKNVPLTIFDGLHGPPDYKLSDEADVTVLMWVKSDVKANYAFAEGKLDKKAIASIVHDTSKILD